MRTRLIAIALALLALPAFSAVQYEFVQKHTTDDAVAPTSDLTARATIDGPRSRVDFIGGTTYPPGTFVISNDGAQRLFFVDPTKRWYTEFNAGGVATALGASNIRIRNLKPTLVVHEDKPVILGIETEHATLKLAYDITVTRKGIPISSHVETLIESWMAAKYGDAIENSTFSISRTGNAEIDQLIQEETSRLKGLPLRQTVTTRTTFSLPPRNSELKVTPTRTTIREIRVTSIRELAADASLFTIPAGYRRADNEDAPFSSTKTLNFQPPSK